MTARAVAVKALMRQERDGYANLVLDAVLKQCDPPLAPRDAAFAARIFYTTLERLNLLDYALQPFSKKPLAKLDAPVRAILRSGLAQAWYMEVPLPAAVNESVKLTRHFGKSSAAGMVNAILRRAAATDVQPQQFAAPIERLTVAYSMARPVAQLLYDQYGAEAEPMVAAFYAPRHTTVRVNTLCTDDARLTQELTEESAVVAPGPWEHCLQVSFSGTPAACKAFRQGTFHVQGLASQFAALCVQAQPGQRVLDLCAAPGGKSLTLAYAMQNIGELLSGEGIKSRVSLLQKAFDRCGVTCATPMHSDASVFDETRGTFDRVLCDVPCSGLGVMGKKPDIRYKSLDGVENLYRLQQSILQNGIKYLAQNGRLVYSTCTVNRCENEDQIKALLQVCPDLTVVPPPFVPQGALAGEYGTLFLPHKTGTDGFFVSILERKR